MDNSKSTSTSRSLSSLIKKSAVVLLTNAFDPYCLQAQETLDNLKLPKGVLTKVFVDEIDNGQEVESESIKLALAKDVDSLPHIYLNGKFFFGAEELEKLRSKKTLKYTLIDNGILPKPNMGSLDEIISKTKFVAIVNSFSAYCFSALEIIQVYELGGDESIVKIVYVDKLPDGGEEIEQAALYKAKCANLPVMFINGEPIGSLDELKTLHEDCTLEQKLVDAGVFQKPAIAKLTQLKTETPLLVLKNSFSAYCLNVEDVLNNLPLPSDKLKYVELETEEGELLQRAARLETKVKEAPYIFIGGNYLPTEKFLEMSKDKKLSEALKKAGAL